MADRNKGTKMLDAEIEKKPRLESPNSHSGEVLELWRNGMPSGEKTGWESLDSHWLAWVGQERIC